MSSRGKLMVLGAAGLALVGCASPEELRQADISACRSYGFVEGTEAFAYCMQQENLARNQPGYPAMSVGVGGGFGSFGGFSGGGLGFGF